MPRVIEVSVPQASKIRRAVGRVDFCDAYEARLSRPTLSVEQASLAVVGHMPGWARALMTLRGWVVYAFGLKHPTKDMYQNADAGMGYQVGQRLGLFTIQSLEANELIAGEDDRHLNFRVSVYKAWEAETITVSTVVEIHNMFGRVYMLLIKPFHRLIVRSMLQNAVNAGRL